MTTKYLTFLLLCLWLQQSHAQTSNPAPEHIIELVSPQLNKFQNVRDFSISPNEEEAFFTIQSPNQDLSKIVCVKNKKWNNPIILPFCDNYSYLEPFLAKDGKRLYFASDRPKKCR